MVVAHRGSSAAHAEHTLAAYELAIEEGADALECDVRLTRDGVLVCVHDRKVNRTSDGRGVVSTLELAELAELDFASWKARQHDSLLEAAWEGRTATVAGSSPSSGFSSSPSTTSASSSCTSRPSTPPGTAGSSNARSSTCSSGTRSRPRWRGR